MKPALLWLFALVATITLWHYPGRLAEGYDWRYFESSIETARRSVVWFHSLPLYDPWMCGGEVQLANPQSIAGSPAFLLVVLFGTAVGLKLMLVLFIGLGLDGTYRLARHGGLSSDGAFAAALSFGLSGWIVAHLSIGHVSFFGATLIPHLVYFYRRALTERAYALAAGGMFAFVVAQGGNSTAVMAALALGAVVVADSIAQRSARPIATAAITALAAVLLGAYRLFPALEFVLQHPRHTNETDGLGILQLLRAGFVVGTSGKLAEGRYGLHEYAWRLPFLAWPLALAGIVAMIRGRVQTNRLGLAALALGLVGFSIALGDALPFGPWWVMRHTPVLRDLRVPSRYILLGALALSLCAGAGLDAFRSRLSPRSIVLGAGIVLAALALDGAIYANAQLRTTFALVAPPVDHAGFYQVQGHWSQMLPLVFANRGVVGCDEEAPLTRADALELGPRAQATLEGQRADVTWRPNGYDVRVATDHPTTLVFNTNWNEHYKASLGTVTRWGGKWKADRDGGRVAVELPAANGTLEVRYSPTSFWLGLWISIASWIAAIAIYARRRRAGGGTNESRSAP